MRLPLLTRLGMLVGLTVPQAAWALHVPADYLTIQAAVDAADEWDTIFVDPDTYENEGWVLVYKSVGIRPEKDGYDTDSGTYDTGTVTSGGVVHYPNFLVVDASLQLYDGVIDSFVYMEGSSTGDSFSGYAGIAMLGSGELGVTDVVIDGGPGYGIVATRATVWLEGGAINNFWGAPALKAYTYDADVIVYVDGTSFSNNLADSINVVAYAEVPYAAIEVSNATFSGNVSQEVGGDIRLFHVDVAEIDTITSVGSSAAVGGGSLAFIGTPATVSNSSFTLDWSGVGGAIYVEGDGVFPTVNVTDSTFDSNTALEYGGDLGGTYTNVVFTRVRSNDAYALYGGSMALLGGAASFDDSQFYGSLASAAGVYYGEVSSLRVTDTEFCGAAADTAGVLLLNAADLTLDRVVLQLNDAYAGALVESYAGAAAVYDTSIIDNYAGVATLYGQEGSFTVINTLFDGNSNTTNWYGVDPVEMGFNLYSDTNADGSEYTTLGGDVYDDPVFSDRYVRGVCGGEPWLAEESPAIGAGWPYGDDTIGAFPGESDDTGGDTGGDTGRDTSVDTDVDTAVTPDSDADGTADDLDCAPGNPDIHPGAYDDPLDEVDQDCDGDAASGLAHGGCGCGTTRLSGVWVLALAALLRRRRARIC